MLERLLINNIALIDNIEINFGEGLNIFSGETGAGKSIIIDSIYAVLGQRTSKDLIRSGTDRAYVEALFYVNGAIAERITEMSGIEAEPDGSLIFSRELLSSGKNVCRINGRLVTAATLKEAGSLLIDIHGQHDSQSLLVTENHIEMLDDYAGADQKRQKAQFADLMRQYRDVRKQLDEISTKLREKEQRTDFLKFQAEEIGKAKLIPGEDEDLGRQKNVGQNAEKIIASLTKAYELVGGGGEGGGKPAKDAAFTCAAALKNIEKYDERFSDFVKRAEEIAFLADDLAAELRSARDEIDFDPETLSEIEARLDVIYKMKRKYGDSIESILATYENIKTELDAIENSSTHFDELTAQRSALLEKLTEAAESLRAGRINAAESLKIKISDQLAQLEMKNTKFEVQIEPLGPEKFTDDGADRVEFLISPNPGEPLKPLAKIASGGEMSRIMLAIKIILAGVDKIPTMIFDEIDNGIGGKVSISIADKLAELSKGHQVICITHIARIAAAAKRNFLIRKSVADAKTTTSVTVLHDDALVSEIARLISGNADSQATLDLAREMIFSSNSC